jgi:hypothetical protein
MFPELTDAEADLTIAALQKWEATQR